MLGLGRSVLGTKACSVKLNEVSKSCIVDPALGGGRSRLDYFSVLKPPNGELLSSARESEGEWEYSALDGLRATE